MIIRMMKLKQKYMNTSSRYYFLTFLIVAVSTAMYLVYSIKKVAATDFAPPDYSAYLNDEGKANKPDVLSTVTLTLPTSKDKLSSPVKVKGSAPGTWFFEATLVVKIIDADGNILGQGPAMAKGEWMTDKLVPFEAIIPFTTSTTNSGTINIEADDPSGRGLAPKKAFPIIFAKSDVSESAPSACTGSGGVCMKDISPKM